MEGLASGASIADRGMLELHVEAGGKIVPLRLHAVHVPAMEQRLLCPQQILQELFPSNKEHSI